MPALVTRSWLNIKGFLFKCSDDSQPVIIALIFLRSRHKTPKLSFKESLISFRQIWSDSEELEIPVWLGKVL